MRALLQYLYQPTFWQVMIIHGNLPEKQTHQELLFRTGFDQPFFPRCSLPAGERGPQVEDFRFLVALFRWAHQTEHQFKGILPVFLKTHKTTQRC